MKSDFGKSGKEMINPHHINQAYADLFKNWFIDNFRSSRKAYFVTLTFEHESYRRQRRQAEGLSSGSFEWKAFNDLYNQTCRKLVGRNYDRSCNQHRLPHVAAFLDAEGTRHWRSLGDIYNLHFHSIWIIDENDRSAFQDTMSMNGSMGSTWQSMSFDEIDVKPIDTDDRGNIDRAISYGCKLVGFNNEKLSVATDFDIYPRRR